MEGKSHLIQEKKVVILDGHLGVTTCQDGHVHLHPGVTSKPIKKIEGGHIHKAGEYDV